MAPAVWVLISAWLAYGIGIVGIARKSAGYAALFGIIVGYFLTLITAGILGKL